MQLTSRQMLNAIDRALAEVARRLASGELDQSGRYYSDAELRGEIASSKPRRKSSTRARTASSRRSRKSS